MLLTQCHRRTAQTPRRGRREQKQPKNHRFLGLGQPRHVGNDAGQGAHCTCYCVVWESDDGDRRRNPC